MNQVDDGRIMDESLPISEATWQNLIQANRVAMAAGWATEGVFHTGLGADYHRGKLGRLLCVGKSPGPRRDDVGFSLDRVKSAQASANWMLNRENPRSHFWQFFEQIDPTRRTIAWTNVCKMDDGSTPTDREFRQVAIASMNALAGEIIALLPHVTVFSTSGRYDEDVRKLLLRLGYSPDWITLSDRKTKWTQSPEGRFAIIMRHPQGWAKDGRQRVIALLKKFLGDTRYGQGI
jgi:hypothetical protein